MSGPEFRFNPFTKNEIQTLVVNFSFVAFLLTFPHFGPVATKIVAEKGLDPFQFFSGYLLSHIAGIGVAGVLLDRIRLRITFSKLIAVILLIFSTLTYFYPLFISIVGFLLGFIVVGMGTLLARHVRPWMRGKVLAIGASLANVYLVAVEQLDWDALKLVLLATLPLLPMFFLSEIEFDLNEGREINLEFVRFILPVAVFYILGGVMYGKMEPVFVKEGIKTHVLFYASTVLLAGYVYDRIGRRPVSIFGIFLIAFALVSFPLNYTASAYLIQSSFAFIDIFAMLVWADLSYYGSEAKQYALGIFLIVSAIFVGFVISQTINISYLVIEGVLIALLLSTLLIASAGEPMKSPEEYMIWAKRLSK